MKRGKYNATPGGNRRHAWLLGNLEGLRLETVGLIGHAGSETARALCGACGITVSLTSPTEFISSTWVYIHIYVQSDCLSYSYILTHLQVDILFRLKSLPSVN